MPDLPPLGLNGDYHGTCTSCLRPTDTGIAVTGEAVYHLAFMHLLGMPQHEAEATLSACIGEVPGDRFQCTYRVCAACAERAPRLPAPALVAVGAPVPCWGQPPEATDA